MCNNLPLCRECCRRPVQDRRSVYCRDCYQELWRRYVKALAEHNLYGSPVPVAPDEAAPKPGASTANSTDDHPGSLAGVGR